MSGNIPKGRRGPRVEWGALVAERTVVLWGGSTHEKTTLLLLWDAEQGLHISFGFLIFVAHVWSRNAVSHVEEGHTAGHRSARDTHARTHARACARTCARARARTRHSFGHQHGVNRPHGLCTSAVHEPVRHGRVRRRSRAGERLGVGHNAWARRRQERIHSRRRLTKASTISF